MSQGSLTGPSQLLREARALAAKREWRLLAATLREHAIGETHAEPELAFLYADASLHLGNAVEAARVAERTLPEVRRGGDRRLLLQLINVLGIAHFESGRMEEAETRLAELLELSMLWEDEEFAARAANNLGVAANVRGRRELALAFYQRALAAYRRLGHLRGLAQTHYNLGLSYRDLHFDAEADRHYRRAIELAEAAGSDDVIALAETERGMLRARWGDGALAESMAARARQRFEEIGDPTGAAQAIRVLAAGARSRGDHELAEARLQEALAIAHSHEDAILRADVQRDRGLLLRDLGRSAEAREALLDAADHFDRMGAVAEAGAVRAIADDPAFPPP